jgi:hypothetical protein
MRGSSPRKTTWGDMKVDNPLILQEKFARTALPPAGGEGSVRGPSGSAVLPTSHPPVAMRRAPRSPP